MSRSAFAEHFTRFVGIPPMQYLTNWRMQVAANRLLSTTDSVSVIADRVGYDSEAAFSRAFKKLAGAATERMAQEPYTKLRRAGPGAPGRRCPPLGPQRHAKSALQSRFLSN